jgi:hypothetical protein
MNTGLPENKGIEREIIEKLQPELKRLQKSGEKDNPLNCGIQFNDCGGLILSPEFSRVYGELNYQSLFRYAKDLKKEIDRIKKAPFKI